MLSELQRVEMADDLHHVEVQRLDQNPAAVYLASLASAHSRRNMKRDLDLMADMLQSGADALTLLWQALRYQHTAALRARLVQQYSPATVNHMLSALRGVLKQAWKLGAMTAEDYQRAIDRQRVKGETLPAGREIDDGEVRALVQACKADTSPAGIRDAAMIGVLYTGGIRRAELAALELADVDISKGKLKVRQGKGRKQRLVYVGGGALLALQAWVTVRGTEPGPLFVPVNKGGKLTMRHMTDQAVYAALKKRAEQAGVKDFSPHDFRRTFVSELLDRGADIVTVQKLAGHADVKTTARYDRRPEEAKRKAAGLLHFPF